MTLDGFRCKKPYQILTADEIEKIHTGSMEILEETGMTSRSLWAAGRLLRRMPKKSRPMVTVKTLNLACG